MTQDAAATREMIARQLVPRGITDPRVLEAIERVPRARFVPPEHQTRAYGDHALPLALGQTISQPYIVALMSQHLAPRPGDRVLEIGSGSGYQTAILALLAEAVYAVERLAALADQAQETLAALGLTNVRQRVGDGTLGWPEQAPFDRILIAAGGPAVPEVLLDQLADHGRLIAPIGDREQQRLICVTRSGKDFHTQSLCDCRFVPLLGVHGWPDSA